jgi:NAD(P)-dependent dehydrogenase (short-subunit alcohol dehydrogenase family)
MFEANCFKDRTVLITGGGTGLGRAMGERLAQLGASLVLTSRKTQHLDAGRTAMEAHGARVVTIPCDIRDPDAVEAMVAEAYAQCGHIDGLINNAAGNIAAQTETLSPNAFNAVVGIVLNGSYYCSQALGKRWIADKRPGNVVSIVTTYAWTGSGYVVPSACAKAGVLAMTRSLAVEWGRHKIRLNAIAPGPFPTEGAWKRLVPPEFQELMLKRNPSGRAGKHEELGNLVAYLLHEGSGYINGECITIDGGEWIAGAGQFNWLRELSDEAWEALRAQAKT